MPDTVLTVAVLCYNVEEYLERCLNSFADERFNDRLQVLIVNDGSTDRTQEIAVGYLDRFPRIFTLISKENGGHGSGVNVGISNAAGTYFRIVDGDDWVSTENLAKLLTVLGNSQEDLIVDCKREVSLATGESTFFPLPQDIPTDCKLSFAEMMPRTDLHPYLMLHTLNVRTDLLRQSGLRVEEGVFYEDIEYVIKATFFAKTVRFTSLEIYQYLVGNTAQSVYYKNYVRRYDHHLKVTRALLDFYRQKRGGDEWDAVQTEYLTNRILLLLNTHFNIALIYDDDRKRGALRGKSFRRELKQTAPELAKMLRKRYYITKALHILGIRYEGLQRLKGNRHG